jgi:hypothetical protein
MISIWHFPHGIRSQALALSLVIVMMTTTTLTTAITISSPPLVQGAFADHGQEIVLSPKDTSFAPLSSGEGNQVKMVVNYAVHEPMVENDLVKGVMKVYSPDGTLLKTSSSPTPFSITESGTATFATTLTDPTIEDVTAKIVFTNPTKTETISNELPVNANLIKDAALPGEPRERAISQVPQESDSQSEEDEPLPEDKLPSTESAIASSGIEEEQQLANIEDVPVIHQSPQMAPTEPQTITRSYVSPSPPLPLQTMPELEICNDSIDNDLDSLIDMSDTDCNPSQIQLQQQQQPTLQQEPVIVSSPEICDDDLDNDLDSKIDSRDEECGGITSSLSSIPSPRQAQSIAGEQIEENEDQDEDKEQESDDGSKESDDGEDNNSEENEDEDEE